MRVAPDGKPYQVDNLNRELYDNEVEIIQFLRPNGKRRFMTCEVSLDVARMSRNMVISAEQLTTGEVAIYVRDKAESIESEMIGIVENRLVSGESPQSKLVEMIRRKYGKGDVSE